MNIKNLFFLIIIASLAISCGGDDDGNSNPDTNFDYFPLTLNNSWDYDIATGTTVLNDNLEVTAVNSSSYEVTATPVPANGIMSNFLSSGELSQGNGQLLISGNLGFDFQGLSGFDIIVNDAPIYDQNASANQEIYTTSGTFTETVNNIDLDINYTARNIQLADEASITVPAGTFNDVIHSRLIIELSISTEVTVVGITQTIQLLNPSVQDVITIDNYWAQDVGLIKSDNQLEYNLGSIPGVNLPIPQSADVLTTQELTAYTVN